MTNESEERRLKRVTDAADRELEEMQRRTDKMHDEIDETRRHLENEREHDDAIGTSGSASEPAPEDEETEE